MEFIDLKKQYSVLKSEIDANIQNVLNKGNFISGEEVDFLAQELAAFCGTKYCLPCANGTDALTLALRCLDIKKGDAVFVPTFTFFASAEAISLEGATPVFVDVDERTFNLDPLKLEKAIIRIKAQAKLNLKAIIVVDLFGLPANYKEIKEIANKYQLLIIEDGAQGFGGSINEKMACSFGDISTTSFFPAKPLGCYGDGGAIFTDNYDYYNLMKSLAVHGKGSYKYDNIRIGYNSRLDTIQAAILLIKLKAFKEYELTSRNNIAEKYTCALSGKYITPLIPAGYGSSWAQYTLILKSNEERGEIQKKLKNLEIPTMIYYPIPLHKQCAYKDNLSDNTNLNVAESLCNCVLSIPMHPYLKEDEQNKIIKALLS